MELPAAILLIAGATWYMLAGLGVVRMSDVFGRLHAATKATTFGLGLIVAGAAVSGDLDDAPRLILAFVLVLLTAPVGAHLLGRAVHDTPGTARVRIDTRDDLRDDQASPPA